MRVTRSRRARQDLIEIWRRIAPDSERAADAQLDRIDEACQRLAQFPLAGPARNDLRPGLRHLVVKPYLVLYEASRRRVLIVRIVDGRRELSTLFRQPPNSE